MAFADRRQQHIWDCIWHQVDNLFLPTIQKTFEITSRNIQSFQDDCVQADTVTFFSDSALFVCDFEDGIFIHIDVMDTDTGILRVRLRHNTLTNQKDHQVLVDGLRKCRGWTKLHYLHHT